MCSQTMKRKRVFDSLSELKNLESSALVCDSKINEFIFRHGYVIHSNLNIKRWGNCMSDIVYRIQANHSNDNLLLDIALPENWTASVERKTKLSIQHTLSDEPSGTIGKDYVIKQIPQLNDIEKRKFISFFNDVVKIFDIKEHPVITQDTRGELSVLVKLDTILSSEIDEFFQVCPTVEFKIFIYSQMMCIMFEYKF